MELLKETFIMDQLMDPGIYRGIGIDDYHAGPGISKTGLDLISRSPEVFWGRMLDPLRPPERERAGQLEGTLAHCAILEPGEFDKRYVVGPDCRRGTKAWTAFEEDHRGKVIIKPAQYEVAMRQGEKAHKNAVMAEAVSRGEAELSAYAIRNQVLCRVRPDWVFRASDLSAVLIDVKTYSSASPDEFARQCAAKRYYVQDAFYSDIYESAAEVEVLAFLFLVIETEWPYACSVCELSETDKALGAREYRRNLHTYKRCLQTNTWPGYAAGIAQISMPRWPHIKEEESE